VCVSERVCVCEEEKKVVCSVFCACVTGRGGGEEGMGWRNCCVSACVRVCGSVCVRRMGMTCVARHKSRSAKHSTHVLHIHFVCL